MTAEWKLEDLFWAPLTQRLDTFSHISPLVVQLISTNSGRRVGTEVLWLLGILGAYLNLGCISDCLSHYQVTPHGQGEQVSVVRLLD